MSIVYIFLVNIFGFFEQVFKEYTNLIESVNKSHVCSLFIGSIPITGSLCNIERLVLCFNDLNKMKKALLGIG